MNQWQIEGLNKLERIGYLGALRELVWSHACAFWWFDDALPVGQSILHNGTITFVNTGAEVLGITAYHVYEGYLCDKTKNPGVKCQIGSVTVEPEKYVAATDMARDLVIFKLPSVLVGGTRVVVHNSGTWPPHRLNVGDLVILGGYPGARRGERIGHADFDFASFIGRVSQSSDDHVALHLNIPHSHWPQVSPLARNPILVVQAEGQSSC